MPIIPQAVVRPYRVTENAPIAEGSFRLLLEPIEEPIPAFKAGQWVGLHLMNPDGTEWAKAAYSIASAPATGGTTIELGIKVAGDFTQRALTLQPGDIVKLQGPWGVFTMKEDQPRMVMFAAGIGSTPFLSMMREIVARSLTNEVLFFYTNRNCAEASYVEELRGIAKTRANFKLIEVCTREPHPEGDKETRRIDGAMIDQYVSDYAVGEYLMCGPREFMDDLKGFLQTKGVDPKRIRKELFS